MRAITYATKMHDGQKRKVDQSPYIAHPYRVAMLLASYHCDQDTVIAGLLHDVVEDTEGTIEDIKHLFNENIATLVHYVTEMDKNVNWEERKLASIKKMQHAPLAAKLVSCADKIDNLQSMIDSEQLLGVSIWHAFVRGKEKQIWYYTQMHQSIATDADHPLITMLASLLHTFNNG